MGLTCITILVIVLQLNKFVLCTQCDAISVTTASGTHAPIGSYCSGQLLFEDTFDTFEFPKWQHEITLTGSAVSIKLIAIKLIEV